MAGFAIIALFDPGKQRSKKEAEMNTNRHNPGGHERKIATKLINMEKNLKTSESAKNKS